MKTNKSKGIVKRDTPNIPDIYEASIKDKHDSPLAILDNDKSNRIEVYVLNRRPIFSTVVGKEDGQKPFDVMTNRLTFCAPALPTTEGSPINDKGESAEDNEPIFDNIIWDEYNERYPDAEDGYRYDKFEEGAQFGRIWAQQQYAQKVKAVIDPIFKKYQKYRDNLQWHIDTNFPVDKDEVEQRISEQDEVIKDLGTILTQLNNIK